MYILTNKYCTVLYNGVTRDLVRRVYEHKNHLDKDSFTSKYNVTRLVYFEETSDVRAAIEREKANKKLEQKQKNISDYGKKSKLGRSVSENIGIILLMKVFAG